MLPDPVVAYLAGASRYLSFPSLSVGVMRREEPLRTFAVPGGAAGPRAYKVGSLTKLVTALAVLALVEDGEVALGDPVNRYLGWFPAPRGGPEPVTLLDLMRHSAGLPRGGLFLGNPTAAEVEAVLLRAEAPAPSPAAHYSNLGYVVLGLVIEAVCGEAYASFVARRLLGPLGMRDSGFGGAAPGVALTPPHCLACFRPESTSPCDYRPMPLLPAPHASHDLTSTVEDFSLPLARLLDGGPAADGAIGSRATATLLAAAWPPAGRLRTGPGYRYAEGRYGGVYFENGEHFGHSASLLLLPARGVALVAMTNRGSAGLDLAHVLNTLAGYYLEGLDPARLNHHYPGAAALAGAYTSASGARLTLSLRGGALHASADGEPPSPLVYKGQRCFVKPAGRYSRYGMRLDPHTGPPSGLCVGPHYFSRGGGAEAADPHPALAGVYRSPTAGRVALFGRNGKLVLAFAPFKEAELAAAGRGAFVQVTGPFRGERVHVCGDATLRIGTLTFNRIIASY